MDGMYDAGTVLTEFLTSIRRARQYCFIIKKKMVKIIAKVATCIGFNVSLHYLLVDNCAL